MKTNTNVTAAQIVAFMTEKGWWKEGYRFKGSTPQDKGAAFYHVKDVPGHLPWAVLLREYESNYLAWVSMTAPDFHPDPNHPSQQERLGFFSAREVPFSDKDNLPVVIQRNVWYAEAQLQNGVLYFTPKTQKIIERAKNELMKYIR